MILAAVNADLDQLRMIITQIGWGVSDALGRWGHDKSVSNDRRASNNLELILRRRHLLQQALILMTEDMCIKSEEIDWSMFS